MYMVKINKTQAGATYKCEECGFTYAVKDLAKQCEQWCRKYGNCSMAITAQSLERRLK